MSIEAAVTERLQKLRQWQAEQQEKLLKEQQMQREILSHEQDRIYKALGFSIHDLNDIIENTNELILQDMIDEHKVVSKSLDNTLKKTIKKEIVRDTNALHEEFNEEKGTKISNCSFEDVNDSRNSAKDYSFNILQKKHLDADLLIEGVVPLPLNNGAWSEHVSLDDVPVPSSKKDFQMLLEEKLNKESDVVLHNSPQIKVKKPFLRKGQGLSRFKMSANSPAKSTTTRRRSTPLSVNTQHVKRVDKSIKAAAQKDAPSERISNEKRQSSMNTVPSSREKVPEKSIAVTPTKRATATSNGINLSETSVSDFDSKTQRELEEVRIFELLEEKAENSSFCSTSSTVLAFLQQTTPFKVRDRLNRSESEVAANVTRQRHDKRMSDTAERLNAVRRLKQLDLRQRSHTRFSAAAINSYWDTITVDDSTEEEAPKQRPMMMIDETSRSDEDRLTDHDTPVDERAVTVSLTDSDEEERDVSMGHRSALVLESKHLDSSVASHRVRFSDHNEYRTIDFGNVSNASSRSSLTCYLMRDGNNELIVNTSSESSDVEEKLPLNYKKDVPVQGGGNERAINASSLKLSLQQDITEGSYYRIVEEEENAVGCEDELPGDDREEVVETYDEERTSVLSSSPQSSSSSLSSLTDAHQGSSAYQKKEYALTNEPTTEKTDNKTNTFQPELLKSRLFELEKEIDIFRKESSALLLQRRKLQEDQATLRKEYGEKERDFEENKRRVQIQLEEEKRRLAREKAAMENRIRDAQEKARQNKIERQKTQNLEEELEKLRDELNIKESRWNAAESRYKSELRALRTEISKLKQEITSLQTAKKANMKNVRRTGGQIFARAVDRRVNKPAVTTSSKEIPAKTSRDSSAALPDNSVCVENTEEEHKDKARIGNEPIEPAAKTTDGNSDFAQTGNDAPAKKMSKQEREIGSRSKRSEKLAERNADEARRKRDLYKNLLNDATSDLVAGSSPSYIVQGISELLRPIVARDPSAKYNDEFYSSSVDENLERRPPSTAATARVAANNTERYDRSRERVDGDERDEEDTTTGARDRDPLAERTENSSLCRRASNSAPNIKDVVRQIEHPDGRIEYWYPNGNVKKIFPEQGMTKMIYYNGDVRETERDGRVKYFYATTRTWHTTTPDGLEILEFPEYVGLFVVSIAYRLLTFSSHSD